MARRMEVKDVEIAGIKIDSSAVQCALSVLSVLSFTPNRRMFPPQCALWIFRQAVICRGHVVFRIALARSSLRPRTTISSTGSSVLLDATLGGRRAAAHAPPASEVAARLRRLSTPPHQMRRGEAQVPAVRAARGALRLPSSLLGHCCFFPKHRGRPSITDKCSC